MGKDARFGHIWKNVYQKHDYQDAHIHPHSQWSFVIYVDVTSRTSFFNPSIHNIQNHFGCTLPQFALDYKNAVRTWKYNYISIILNAHGKLRQ